MSTYSLFNLKKSVESNTGAYCTESKAFFTFLKLTHRVAIDRFKKAKIRSIFNTLDSLATIQLLHLGSILITKQKASLNRIILYRNLNQGQ